MNSLCTFFGLFNQAKCLLFVVAFAEVRFEIGVHFYKEFELSLVVEIFLGLNFDFVGQTTLGSRVFFGFEIVGQLRAKLPALFY